ncbi:MAG: DUF3798 domain-containing protein [Deltaproteobacteria bacterium]|jgi:hypothetical protein|nr:DUF3798 domain-containing protein [Deltaproteobacteria bacterium]
MPSRAQASSKKLILIPIFLVVLLAAAFAGWKIFAPGQSEPAPTRPVAPAPTAEAPPARVFIDPLTQGFHIGLVTASGIQGDDSFWGAKQVLEKYGAVEDGGLVKHVTYPDNFVAELSKSVETIEILADDPYMKVIYVMEAIPGTSEAFNNIRLKRPDILLLASESHEDAKFISTSADLVVNADFISRGYLIPYAAKLLGAKTFVHVSFPRHMLDESLSRRRAIMEVACEELGLKFVYENAIDPTGDEGMETAINFMLEKTPEWISEYGPDTAFFNTNNALTAPMIAKIVEFGGFFVEADEASPLMGYPQALGLTIDAETASNPEIIQTIERALIERGASGRLGTWTSSLSATHIQALVEFGRRVVLGEIAKDDLAALLGLYHEYSNGISWNGSIFKDASTRQYDNVFLIYQDTYIFGKGYLDLTSLEVPPKYWAVNIGDVGGGAPAAYHVAIVTGPYDQGAEDVIGAQEMIRRYGSVENGGLIAHVLYPSAFLDDVDAVSALIEGLAEDPLLKVIVVNQAIPGTAEGFRRVKAKRPEVFLLSGEPHEAPETIAEHANLVVAADYISRGYLIPYSAKELGSNTFVHISFPRHMSYPSLALRAKIMEEACADLGMSFYRETAPDPVEEGGIKAARDYILSAVPQWLEKYGTDATFFTTNDAHTEPLLEVLAERGGFFVEADIPSPLLGYPRAFKIDAQPFLGQWNLILKVVEEAVVEAGAAGRLGTWAYPMGFTQSAGLVEFGKLLAENKTTETDVNAIVDCLGIFSPGARWSGAFLNDSVTGRPMRNFFLAYQDTYILGKGYIETTKVEVPDKYYAIRLD